MSGIYIKGFPIPNNCGACPLRLAWCRERIYMVTRPERCPLVPIPPHGRLIDANALMKHKGDCYDSDGHLLYAVGTGTIMRMPAIIPADKEGEG